MPQDVDRARALSVGWVLSRARNRWLLWKDQLGRLQWFETGRANLYLRRLAHLGRACQLVCNGFSFRGLVTDFNVLEGVLAGVKSKGAHYVFKTEHRLPKLVIDLFMKSNGVVIKVGDASHPNAVEVVTCYPDWAERLLLRRIRSTIFSTCYYDKDQREIVSGMSRQDLLSLISEPVQVGWLPDFEKGEVVVNSRGEDSFQKMVDGRPPYHETTFSYVSPYKYGCTETHQRRMQA